MAVAPAVARCDEPAQTPRAQNAAASSSTAEPAFGLPRTGQSHYGWNWLASRYDKNQDGSIREDEFTATAEYFTRLDRDWDGRLTDADFDWSAKGQLAERKETTFALFKSVDSDSDGHITSEEWHEAFTLFSANHGFLNDEALENLIFSPLLDRRRKMQARREQGHELGYDSKKPAPEPGEVAPDFELRTPDGSKTIRLSSFRDNKPVVLIFGSFT
jgi:Ca2+-binding EF-hand superfamily protein